MSTPHLNVGIELLCVLAGLLGGFLAVGATGLVYLAEDGFRRLPIHWMWWPAIGGVIIGVGGLIEPHALGVGYDVIDKLLTGRAGLSLVLGILTVKTAIWSLSLGSGTSGGVLAPVFMIGASLGALEAHVFPPVAPGFWALVGLAAVLGGVMRSPLTGVVFPLELTHAWGDVLPLVIAATAAYALSTLILKRSVLTEKVARRGLHLTREYSVDPLELMLVSDVMETYSDHGRERNGAAVVYADDTLRHVAYQFAEHQLSSAPVVAREDASRVLGVIRTHHLLAGRLRDLREEHHRERVLVRRISPDGKTASNLQARTRGSR